MRQADLLQLEQIAQGYPSRERFLTELTLDPPDATSDEAGAPLLDEDYLILSTIHSAKGQEWKSVFVLNCVDGCIPSDLATGTSAEIEEERRLLYVAMTRAKDHLHLIVPQRFLRPSAAQQRRPSHVCGAHALHPGRHAAPVRALRLAAGRRSRYGNRRQARRSRSTSARACAACGADPLLADPIAAGLRDDSLILFTTPPFRPRLRRTAKWLSGCNPVGMPDCPQRRGGASSEDRGRSRKTMERTITMLIARRLADHQQLLTDAARASKLPLRLSTTDNGRDCLTLLNGANIDLAFIDVHMPELVRHRGFLVGPQTGHPDFRHADVDPAGGRGGRHGDQAAGLRIPVQAVHGSAMRSASSRPMRASPRRPGF